MSTETTGNGQQEAAAEAAPIAATDVAETAGAVGTVQAVESDETGESTESDDDDEPDGDSEPDGDDESDEDDRDDGDDRAAEANRDDEATAADGANDVVEPDNVDEYDEDEPTDLIAMTEPVQLAEPVEEARPRRWPRVLLAVGFVLAAAAIVGGAIAIVGSVTHGFKKPVKIVYKKSALFTLKTGDCFNPKGQSYALIPCGSPHAAEVFATFPLAGTTWPGNAAIAAKASSGCASRLTGYLNPQLAISLASTYVYPDAIAWKAGTRTVICEVRATSGDLTGSVRGATASAG